MQFKVGDRVRVIANKLGCPKNFKGEVYTIDKIMLGIYPYSLRNEDKYWWGEHELELISSTNNNNMDIKEKFVLAITPEPQKSFRKAGITNGDNLLTDEGSRIFLTWLLSKNQDAFKTEVVDDLLKENKD